MIRMSLLSKLFTLVTCHVLGDYPLQIDFIAKTKGSNWYHMFVHCVLYCVPFAIIFGINWNLAFVFVTHFIIDNLKARYNKITYTQDQILHYVVLIIYFVG